MKELRGRVAILTGASRGLGAALAPALAAEGLRLALVARDGRELAKVAEPLGALALPADLRDTGALAALVDRVAAELGPPVVLVNNAGVESFQHFEQAEPLAIAAELNLNLAAALALCRLVLPHQRARGEGQVVNIASTAGLVGTPYGAVYAAGKAGLIAATHSLRMEFHDAPWGYSVLCPGFVHGAGMHELAKAQAGRAPAILGGTTVEAVVRAVVAALRDDPPERIINSSPLRPAIALGRGLPGLANQLTRWMSGGYMRKLADARRSAG